MTQEDNKNTGRDVKTLFDTLGLDASRYQNKSSEHVDDRAEAEAKARWPLLNELQRAAESEVSATSPSKPHATPVSTHPQSMQDSSDEGDATSEKETYPPVAEPFSGTAISANSSTNTNTSEPGSKPSLSEVLGLNANKESTEPEIHTSSAPPEAGPIQPAPNQTEPVNRSDTAPRAHPIKQDDGNELQAVFARLRNAKQSEPVNRQSEKPTHQQNTDSQRKSTGLAGVFARLWR